MKTQVRETSLNAYHSEVLPSLNHRQQQVLDAFVYHENYTNLELSKFLGLEINSITPRIKELRQKGLVKEHCKRECRISGRRALCWEPNYIGLKQDKLL